LCKMPWVGEVTALAKGPNDVASNDVATAALVALGRRLAESSAQV